MNYFAAVLILASAMTCVGGERIFAQDATPVSPQWEPGGSRNTFIIGGQIDKVSGLNRSGGGTFDWVLKQPDGAAVTAGVGSYSLGNSSWTLGRAGVVLKPTSKVILSGLANLGRGETAGTSFGYRTLQGEIAYQIKPRIYFKIGDKYINVGNAHGHLLQTGALWQVSDLIALDLTQSTSVSGNLNTDFFTARADLGTRPIKFFGGGSVGRVTPEVFNLDLGTATQNKQMRQGFFGVIYPMAGSELIVGLDLIRLDRTNRGTVSLALRFPTRQ